MPSLNKLGTVKVPLLVEIELVPVVTVPPLKATAVVAVAAFPVQDPEDPLTFPVTLPVKGPENVVADTVPDTVSFPVMANVPPDGIILLMVEDKETGDDPQGLILVDVLSPVNISSELLDIYVNGENFHRI